MVSADYLPEYSMTYTDANGKVWGYCTYYQGHRNFWMYLDDVKANAKTIYGDNYIVGVVMGENCSTNEVENETDKLIVPNPLRSNKVIGVAVVIVVIATAMILLKMKRIKK